MDRQMAFFMAVDRWFDGTHGSAPSDGTDLSGTHGSAPSDGTDLLFGGEGGSSCESPEWMSGAVRRLLDGMMNLCVPVL